jgi:hypothetical protein
MEAKRWRSTDDRCGKNRLEVVVTALGRRVRGREMRLDGARRLQLPPIPAVNVIFQMRDGGALAGDHMLNQIAD